VADAVAGWFVPAVVLVALLTFGIWMLWGPAPAFTYALVNAVAVLIIACPCALGLATPMSIMVAVGRGAGAGILIRDAATLETLEKIDTLVMDKTGTLTLGRPTVTGVIAAGSDENNLLARAAALEEQSEHPLAGAVIRLAKERNLSLPTGEDFSAIPGGGVRGRVEGHSLVIGSHALLTRENVAGFEPFETRAQTAQDEGHTVMWIAADGAVEGFLELSDPVKETTPDAIRALRALGVRLIMLTGDNARTAVHLARRLGLDEFVAEASPADKHERVRNLQTQGRSVAMAGDGVNDAPALAVANVGIAMGTGTDVAMESAGITLVKGDLRGIVQAIHLSRATMRNIRQNLLFAFLYNALGVPIAAGALYPFFGILLSPIIASAAMSFSSVSVVANALRLRKTPL
jgi:Cu+-exporting ATPase